MLQQLSRPYEVFVRFDEDGETHAHYTVLDYIVDTATGETVGRPAERQMPVTTAAAVAILGENIAVLLQRVASLEAQVNRGTPEVTA